MKRNDRWEKIGRLARFCGRNVSLLFVLSVPLSLLQGVNEILFGLALMMFLSSYGLVTGAYMPAWFQVPMNPFAVLIVIGLARWALTFCRQFIDQLSYEGFQSRVRREVAAALARPAAGATLTVSEVSNLFANLIPKSSAFIQSTLQGFGNCVLVMVTFVGLLRLSASLTLIAAGLTAVLGIPLFLSRKRFQSYSGQVYHSAGKFFARLTRDIRNLSFLSIIGRTAEESRSLVSLSWKIISDYIRYTFWLTAHSTWPQFAAVCVIAVVVRVNHHENVVMASRLIPFVYLLSRVTNASGEVIRCLGNVQFNKPFVGHLLRMVTRLAPTPSAGKPAGGMKLGSQPLKSIEARNLGVGRDKHLLQNVSFSISQGDFLCISGESGKGKTTLLLTLIGLVPPLDGQVLWNGTPLRDVDAEDLQNRCAFSGPDPFLVDSTIRENVLFGSEHLNRTDAEVWEALRLADCGFVESFPKKLDTVLQEGGEGVSAGQKQRLSIARALLRSPEVLILDEATANLDLETEALVLGNVRKKLPKAIILAVSHRESITRFATHRLNP